MNICGTLCILGLLLMLPFSIVNCEENGKVKYQWKKCNFILLLTDFREFPTNFPNLENGDYDLTIQNCDEHSIISTDGVNLTFPSTG